MKRNIFEHELERMDIDTPHGTKVVFDSPRNGYEVDQERAAKHLTVGRVYKVDFTVIHGSSTEVYLIGFPLSFNSVLFGKLN